MNRGFLPLKMGHCAKANHCIGQFVVDYGNKEDHNGLKFFLKEHCTVIFWEPLWDTVLSNRAISSKPSGDYIVAANLCFLS